MSELKDSLEYLQKYIDQKLYQILKGYFDCPEEGRYLSTIDFLSEDFHHAIDHIIVDHCNELDETYAKLDIAALALDKIRTVSGTSTEHWHIANKSLAQIKDEGS